MEESIKELNSEALNTQMFTTESDGKMIKMKV